MGKIERPRGSRSKIHTRRSANIRQASGEPPGRPRCIPVPRQLFRDQFKLIERQINSAGIHEWAFEASCPMASDGLWGNEYKPPDFCNFLPFTQGTSLRDLFIFRLSVSSLSRLSVDDIARPETIWRTQQYSLSCH